MSRKKRQRSRQPNTLDRMIKRVRRSRNIHQRTWRAACEELVLMPDLRRMLRDYIAEHEALLGPDWAASLLLFMAADDNLETQRAKALYTHLLERWPPCAVVEACMGDHLALRSGEIHRGRRHQQRALQMRPDYVAGWYHLGLSWQMLGIFSSAITAWETAMSAEMTSSEAREAAARAAFNRGSLHVNLQSDVEAGKRCMARALELMPDYPQARALQEHLQRGGLLRKLQYTLKTPPERIP